MVALTFSKHVFTYGWQRKFEYRLASAPPHHLSNISLVLWRRIYVIDRTISYRKTKKKLTMRSFIGLMLESEKKIFEFMDRKDPMSKHWMPLVWATNIINTARKEELITSDHFVQTLMHELSDIRQRLGGLIGFDTVSVPLVYTQVQRFPFCLVFRSIAL